MQNDAKTGRWQFGISHMMWLILTIAFFLGVARGNFGSLVAEVVAVSLGLAAVVLAMLVVFLPFLWVAALPPLIYRWFVRICVKDEHSEDRSAAKNAIIVIGFVATIAASILFSFWLLGTTTEFLRPR